MAFKARRGDVFAVVSTERTWYIGQANDERVRVDVGQVTSCTRDGFVKAAVDCRGYQLTSWATGRVLVIPADKVSPDDVLRVAREHHYEGHPGQPKPFDSPEELREALRPHLVT